jgi:hypothetical protein
VTLAGPRKILPDSRDEFERKRMERICGLIRYFLVFGPRSPTFDFPRAALMKMPCFPRPLRLLCIPVLAGALNAQAAQPVVPGTGIKVEQVGDDFEAADWEWYHNWPKSSEENNKVQNVPGGESKNGRWYEGIKRGHPDFIRRVPTPPGGLAGSKGSLLLRSLQTGIPGYPSYRQQQDDFCCNVMENLGGAIPVNQTPSFVTRVFLPPVSRWENRTGCHFAIRAACDTVLYKTSFGSSSAERELFYPGIFIEFEAKEDNGYGYDVSYLRIRADQSGYDFKGKDITTTGWWTFGMSFTPDGAVHYYAKPGIEDLTKQDHLTTQYPHGYRCLRLRTFFFNVCNADDGRTWSTEWIIDDPALYFIKTK